MIVVRLIGGLGNQLFQYALARKIALMFKTDVVLDISPFEKYKLHKYSLDHFKFNKRIITDKELYNYGLVSQKGIRNILYKIKNKICPVTIIRELQFNFNSNIFNEVKKNMYLDGFWQSEKYFIEIRSVLLNELKITKPLEDKNLEYANKISILNSVSLHIRRADYISNSETLIIHGICDLEYYYKAIEYISIKIENPVFFIFSDDIQWVKENLKITFETCYVDHNNADANFEDLRLMSLCKHNIIANSSFSWWGAWLNENENKIIIAPKNWFASNERNYEDVVPENWIKL